MSLVLPTREGYGVSWYTGEETINRRGKVIRWKNSFQSKSKEEVDRKVGELKEAGFEIVDVYECIF